MTGRHAAGRDTTQPLPRISQARAAAARWHNPAAAIAAVTAVTTLAIGAYLAFGQPSPRQPDPAPVLQFSPSTTETSSRAEEKPHAPSTAPRTPRTRYPAPRVWPTSREPAPRPSATRTPHETPRPHPTATPSSPRPSATPTATPTDDWPWPPHRKAQP